MAKTFEPTRAEIGDTVGWIELGKRLAYELQIPDTYAHRLVKAYQKVIEDALAHGEGLNFKGFGTLKLQRYEDEFYPVQNLYAGERRIRMYKFKWTTSPDGREFIKQLTAKERDGTV